MPSFGHRLFGLSLLCAVSSASSIGRADEPKKQQPLILTRETADVGQGDRARARARAGDCKTAVDIYDQAIRTSIEPTLRRDRGLCHEQLQHPFPAIDDYRAYLKDRPQAPDADQIRERLERLEEQVGVGTRSKKPGAAPGEEDGVSASASVSLNGEGARAETSSKGSKGTRSSKQVDFEKDEALAASASGSPLREASGWALGVYFSVRGSPDPSVSGGGTIALGTNETVGAALRYSLGPTSTILGEAGYVNFNKNNIAGPGFFAGYEARFPFTKYASDSIIAGVGLDYERYRSGDNGNVLNTFLPRARLGYRHVFGEAFGLEIHGDGGVAKYWADSLPSIALSGVFGGYIAVVVGF